MPISLILGALAVATAAPLATASPTTTAFFSPQPQIVDLPQPWGACEAFTLSYWLIATDTADEHASFAALELQAFLRSQFGGRGAAPNHGFPIVPTSSVNANATSGLTYVIALGTPSTDPALAALAQAHNVTLPLPAQPLGEEGYVLDACAQGAGIVVAARTAAGAYHGVQTLKQLAANGTNSAGAIAPRMTVTDWPNVPIRGYHVHGLGEKYPAANFYTQADRMAQHKMNFFSVFSVASVTEDLPRNGQMLLDMQEYLSQRHMTMMLAINLGQTMDGFTRTGEGIWAKDVPFVVGADGALAPADGPPVLPLVNGGFEDGWDGWSRFPGSDAGAASSWAVDTAVAHTGNNSARCDIAAGSGGHPLPVSARLLSDPVAVEPGRSYQLSFYYKLNRTNGADRPWVWLAQLDASGDLIADPFTNPTGVQLGDTAAPPDKRGWTQGTVTMVASPSWPSWYARDKPPRNATHFQIYAGGVNSESTFWIDDVAIISLDRAVANVIVTNATNIVVRAPASARNDSAARYVEGRDYAVRAAAGGVMCHVDFRDPSDVLGGVNPVLQTGLTALNGSRLAPGARVLVDYDFQPGQMGFHDYDLYRGLPDHLPWPPNQTSSSRRRLSPQRDRRRRRRRRRLSPHNDFDWGCQSADFVDDLYYEVALNKTFALLDFMAAHGVPLEYINLDYDELNTIARDSRALLSGKTNGELLAGSINRLVGAVNARYPKLKIIFWDDMLNPYHLHAPGSDQDNLQAQRYAREDGTLDTAIDLVEYNDTIIWLNWFYTYPESNIRLNKSLASEWGHGFETWGCPNEDPRNMNCYARAFKVGAAQGQRVGMIDTDWDGKYIGLEPAAAISWNWDSGNASLVC